MNSSAKQADLFDRITAILLFPVEVRGLVVDWHSRMHSGALPVEWTYDGVRQIASTEWRRKHTSRRVHAALYGDDLQSFDAENHNPTLPARSFHRSESDHTLDLVPSPVDVTASELLLLRELSSDGIALRQENKARQEADAILAIHLDEADFGTSGRIERGFLRALRELSRNFQGNPSSKVAQVVKELGSRHGVDLALVTHYSYAFSLIYTNIAHDAWQFETTPQEARSREFMSTWGGGDPPHGWESKALRWNSVNQIRWALAMLNELPRDGKLASSEIYLEEADPGVEVKLNKRVVHLTRKGLSVLGQERATDSTSAAIDKTRGSFSSLYLDTALLAYAQYLLLDQIAESVSTCSDPVSRKGRAIVRQQRTDLRRFGAVWWSRRMSSWDGPDEFLRGLQKVFHTEYQRDSLRTSLESYLADIELDEQRFIGVILGVIAALGIVNVANNALTGLAAGQGLRTVILGGVLSVLALSLVLVVVAFRRWRSEPWRGSRIRS